jgi:hypothetical protein
MADNAVKKFIDSENPGANSEHAEDEDKQRDAAARKQSDTAASDETSLRINYRANIQKVLRSINSTDTCTGFVQSGAICMKECHVWPRPRKCDCWSRVCVQRVGELLLPLTFDQTRKLVFCFVQCHKHVPTSFCDMSVFYLWDVTEHR